MTGYAFAVVLCAVLVGLLFMLMRRRRLREKYAAIWIVVSAGVVLIAIFPRFAFWLAGVVRVETPVNLLFAISAAVLLAVCVQLSTEVSALEEETRTIAEELALLRLEVRSAQDMRRSIEEATRPAPDPHSNPVLPSAVIVSQRPVGLIEARNTHRSPSSGP